ncbi:MAG: dehydratase [Rhodospirillaceae bacterium]|jgi:acyl dehydratase|nr:dehydratase [Rhodospirillaceae bacterium]MBT4043226.1 dehydratase [Rhodospirillaceae bacterium]MBT4690756.1 dehydratase [Rhodospirillaceae bacterium]MBT5078947.1 dehydratase [Rhodospirillaceae bacterium]MBT5522956.1 dehydratase [Rhodospirillaceae bacterium]
MPDLPVVVGDTTTFAKTVGESDIYGFAGITGDFAAPHVNAEFMKNSQYGERVAHGALLVGFMSTASALLATRIISKRDDLTPMSIGYDRVRFTEAVKIGDTISVVYEVKALEPERGRSRAALTATNQDGTVVGVAEHIMKWLVNP